jgi:hypothetical protein
MHRTRNLKDMETSKKKAHEIIEKADLFVLISKRGKYTEAVSGIVACSSIEVASLLEHLDRVRDEIFREVVRSLSEGMGDGELKEILDKIEETIKDN